MEHKGTIRIETDRLVLKRHVLDDAEIMFKNWVTEKDVTKFLSWQPHNRQIPWAMRERQDIPRSAL